MAGAINLANVALGFDASKVTKGVDLSAGEIRKLNSIVKSSESSIDKYNRELHILETAYAKGAISAKRMAEATEHLKRVHGQLEASPIKLLSTSWTELNSKVQLVLVGARALQSAIRPVFDEMNRIDAINDQAHKLGMSYRDLNTIQLSLGESSGIAAEDISKAMQKLSIGLTEAITTGKGAHAEALKTLGLTASGLAGKNQVDQLATIADAMEGIASQSERLKLTFDLFGKTGAGLVSSFDEGGGKLREMAEFADQVGLNLSGGVAEGINNANDAMGRLHMATQGWIAQFSGGAANSIEAIADHLMKAAIAGKGLEQVGENVGSYFVHLYGVIKDVHDILSKPVTQIQSSDFGRTAREVEWKALAAKARAEEQSEQKAAQQKQLSERKGADDKAKAAAEETIRNMSNWFDNVIDQAKGVSDQLVANAARMEKEKKIRGDFEERETKRLKNTNPMNISDTIAPALKAGSVEAYKFMLNQKDKAADIAEQQRKIAEESKGILEKQLDALNAMPKLGLARR